MKKFIYVIILSLILGITYYFRDDLANTFLSFSLEKKETSILQNNIYSTNRNHQYVRLTNDFIADNEKDIYNIIYTILNSGMENFTFYCNYENCTEDIDKITSDRVLLSNINNYIHPFNSFTDMETTIFEQSGKIILNINHLYTDGKIRNIETKVDQIIRDNIKNDMKTNDKIKVIHDYIIKNSKYDSNKADGKVSEYSSDTAYGPLFQGYGICNGYSDLMGIFLYKLGIGSIKISSENHVWNLVNIDNKWYHLDLTWDDPIIKADDEIKETVDYSYFLINTKELHDLDDQHYFDKNIYLEAK